MPYMIMMSEHPRAREPEWQPTGLVFDEGPLAGDWVKQENFFCKQQGYTQRYRVVPLSDDDPLAWRQRLVKQIEEGSLKRPPWYGYYSDTGLYEHIDPDSPTLIRYVANEQDGMASRFTRMTPGRFIMKFLDSHPNPRMLDEWCASMGLDLTVSKLMIARSTEDVVRIYNDGPHSCMAYTMGDQCPFRVSVHPISCYGESDLGVAYILRRGEISARALVWPDKKIYGRIYGDEARLEERLKEEGYVRDWMGFNGARIRQIRDKETGFLIAPYFDGDLGAIKDGDTHLIISDKPHLILKSPYGVVAADECQSCGATEVWLQAETDPDDEDEIIYVCAEGCDN